MKQCFMALLVAALAPICAAVTVPAPIPAPVSMQVVADNGLTLSADMQIVADAAFMKEATFAAKSLNRVTGFSLKAVAGTAAAKGICFVKAAGLPKEGYRLSVKNGLATITATDAAGAFYGFQTLLQLLPPEAYGKIVRKDIPWTAPAVEIQDAPRLQWRGVMLDDARHFLGAQNFRTLVDTMAAHKLNVLHWHLTEDQAWRIEIKKYPQLVLNGARRDQSPVMWNRNKGDGKPYGWYYYTQDQIRELVAYAAERHITVVPEIEMPGHALALLASFPELSCTGGPFRPRWQWGVEPDILCAGNDAVFPFLEDILDEVMALFPSAYIHCGGDEAPKTRWNACPKCQKRIKDLGLKDSHQLQSWFVNHFANYLESKGRHLIGWDEILEGGLPKGASVMSWRGSSGGIKAAKMGHKVVMSPHTHVYLDYGQGIKGDPYEYIGGNLPLQRVYSLNPVGGIPESMHGNVIGVQANAWSEYIWGSKDFEWKVWPRSSALAEIGWTPQAKRDWKDFRRRMNVGAKRLEAMGIRYATLPEEPVTPFAVWKPGDIPTAWTARTWNVTSFVKKAGKYDVRFQYTGGDSRVDIDRVAVLVNGKEVTADVHAGTTGSRDDRNVYTVTLKTLPANAKVEIAAKLRTDGNTDSNGAMTIVPVK